MSVNRVWRWIGRPLQGADSPGLMAWDQPRPLETRVSRLKVAGRWVTSIWRCWSYDDVKDCRLCDPEKCSAVGGACLFLVTENVPDSEAPLYAISKTRRADPG